MKGCDEIYYDDDKDYDDEYYGNDIKYPPLQKSPTCILQNEQKRCKSEFSSVEGFLSGSI